MNRPDSAGPFAGGGGDPFHRAVPDIAHREHAGDIRLEGEGPPAGRLPGWAQVFRLQVDVGPDEAAAAERGASQPSCHRLRADEAEQPAARLLRRLAGFRVPERYPAE